MNVSQYGSAACTSLRPRVARLAKCDEHGEPPAHRNLRWQSLNSSRFCTETRRMPSSPDISPRQVHRPQEFEIIIL